jgi:hypothetical protein
LYPNLKSTALPFDKFEEFVRALLNSRPVIPISEGQRKIELQKHDLVHRYGKQGDAQRGIDLIGTLSGGARIVFQCKYHSADARKSRVDKREADAAIQLAREKYPEAKYYVLVTNSGFTTGAIDSLANAGWLKWGGEQLSDLLRALPQFTGYHLVCDHFGRFAADQLYPLGPDLLVTPKEALASRQDALAHRYACVGREQEIATLTGALTGKNRQAVILSGDGGLGKSRILCEVLSRLDGKKWKPLIVQKMERDESSAKQVALLDHANLLVGMDECHLDGFFREDISLAVLRHTKNGRLLLVCRSEGLPKLRQTLTIQGWQISEPLESSGGLKTMDVDSMEKLAEEILGKNHPQAHLLTHLSCGNPLITVVGGEMLKANRTHIREVIHTDEFRTQVFRYLEDSYLHALDDRFHQSAKRLLHLLALLSPCSESNLPSAAKLLEITEAELDDGISRLRRAGLIRGSNESFRVIPDLFSDHLARQALAKGDDTRLLPRLMKSNLITNGGTAVFRNLAMARWGSDSDNAAIDLLIRSLWESYRRNFTVAHDKERSDLLSSWRKWAVYLPDESLEFAKLALEVGPNRDPKMLDWLYPGLESHYVKALHTDAIHILSDLAKYHINHQERALELLWKHRDKETGSEDRNKPGTIAEVFRPEADRTIEPPLSALKWLGAEVRNPATFRDWTESRTNDPAYFLGPAFATQYDASYTRGNVFHFVSKAFHLDITAPLRDKAMEIIRHISLATVKGALNCIDLLQANSEPFYSMRSGDPGEKWLHAFEQCRLASLRILLEIARHHDDTMVRFLIRKGLLCRVGNWESSPELAEIRALILESIPETHELNLTRVLLSNRYDEFSKSYIEDAEGRADKLQNRWDSLCDMVAAEMPVRESHSLPQLCEEIGSTMKDHGLEPNFYSLFQAFERIDPRHIEDLRKHILLHPRSHFGYLYGNLCLSSDWKLAEAADLNRPDLFSAVCDWLHRQADDSTYPLSRSKVAHHCRAARGALLDNVLASVHFSYLDPSLSYLLLENLPWAEMSAEQLACVAKKMDHRNGGLPGLPPSVYPPLLERLNELPWDAIAPFSEILRDACRRMPALMFGFFEERMRKAMAADSDTPPAVFPSPYPKALSFPDINGIPGYKSKSRTIFDALRADPENHLLREWFRIAVIDSGNLAVVFLDEWIESAEDGTELEEISEIVCSDASRFAFSEPDLIHRLLSKAQSFSRECLRKIEDGIVHSLGFRARGYTNGIPDDQRILNLSREHRERHAAVPLLHELFDKVVRYEEADAEQHRREYLARDEEGRRFK